MTSPGLFPKIRTRMSAWSADELRPTQLVKSLSTGFLLYFLDVIVLISFAALIFSGELSVHIAKGIGLFIIGEVVLIIVVVILSSYSGTIAIEQDIPVAILALAAAAIAAALPASTSPDEQFFTVVVMIAVTSIVTGLFLGLLGVFKLSGLVRFLPYTVIGGFLAATGWLLASGGVGVMVDTSMGLGLLQPDQLIRWLPGLILGLLIFLAVNRSSNPLVLPAMFVGGVLLFYVASWLAKIPISQLRAEGWLLGSVQSGVVWQFPLTAHNLSQVNWPVLIGVLPALVPVLVVSVIALLLNASGLELITKEEINLSREMIIVGIGNLATGMVGGSVGYHAISFTSLNHTMTGGKRLAGLSAALLLGLTPFLSTAFLSYLPKMVMGALLVFIGLSLLYEWLYQAWFKLPVADFLITLIIMVITVVWGFMEGIALGLIMTVILFVVNYSQVSVVKQTFSGETHHSRVTRTRTQVDILRGHAEEIQILKLQGFIFFGTAHNLYEQVRDRIAHKDLSKVRFVLLDFAQVTGLDSTGLLSFNKMLQLAEEKSFTLLLTGLTGKAGEQFARGGFHTQPGILMFFPDLDRGLEWFENQVLAEISNEIDVKDDLFAQLLAILPDAEDRVAKLMQYLERKEVAAGEYLMYQGDEPDVMYFIESGQVTAQLESAGKDPMRLETMGSGRTVGELGFYLRTKRSAAVVADEPSVVYSLSRETLQKMEQTDPDAGSTFHRLIVHLLGERVIHLIKAVEALQR